MSMKCYCCETDEQRKDKHSGEIGVRPVRYGKQTGYNDPAVHFIYVFEFAEHGKWYNYARIARKTMCGLKVPEGRIGIVEQQVNCMRCYQYTFIGNEEKKELYAWKCMVGL